MVYCPRCQAPNSPASRVCDRCGASLGVASAVLTIGRDPTCDIVPPLDAGQVGRRHARVVIDAGRYSIEDLGSVNGTFVNGRRVFGAAPFNPGDDVRCGSYPVGGLITARLSGVAPPGAPWPAPAPAPPYVPPPPPYGGPPPGGGGAPGYGQGPVWNGQPPGPLREPWLVVLLSLVTCGIYMIYWWWVTLDEVRRWRNYQGWAGPMVLVVFIPCVGSLVWLAAYFLLPSYIADLYRRDGRQPPVTGALGFLNLAGVMLGPLFLWMGSAGLFFTSLASDFDFLPFGHTLSLLSTGSTAFSVALLFVGLACSILGYVYLVLVQKALNDFWRSKGAVA